MPYLIDGHNLIPHLSHINLNDVDDELDLIERLRHFSQRKRTRIEVYFDQAQPGQSGERSFGFVAAFFVSRSQTADTAIKRRLASLGGDARNWTVISSDREVLRAAKMHQARVKSAAEFALLLEETGTLEDDISKGKWDPSLSAEEVEYWRQRFLEDDG